MTIEQLVRASLERNAESSAPHTPNVSIVLRRVQKAARRRTMVTVTGYLAAAIVLAVVAVNWLNADTGRNSIAQPASPPNFSSSSMQPQAPADVIGTIAVEGVPSGLVMDPAAKTLYVSTSHGISVVDTTKQNVTDTIPLERTGEELTIDTTQSKLYMAHNGWGTRRQLGTVTVIDTNTHRVDTIIIGERKAPTGLAVDPATDSLFVANNMDGTVSVVDTTTHRVTDTIPVGRNPIGVAVDSAAHAVYVANGNSSSVSVIDTQTRRVTDTIEGVNSARLAVDATAGLLFVANEGDGTVTVINTSTHEVVVTIRVGGYGPFGVTIDSAAQRAYVTGGEDRTMAVIDTLTFEVLETLRNEETLDGRFGDIAISPSTDAVFFIGDDRHVSILERR